MKDPCNITLSVRVSASEARLITEMQDRVAAETGSRPGQSEAVRRIIREWGTNQGRSVQSGHDDLQDALQELLVALHAMEADPADPYLTDMVWQWMAKVDTLKAVRS